QRLFSLLVRALDDVDDAVRLQAAYFLSLLRDRQSEPAVVATIRAVHVKRLSSGAEQSVTRAWFAGPFQDANAQFEPAHPPERGPTDLRAPYDRRAGAVKWPERRAQPASFSLRDRFGTLEQASGSLLFQLQTAMKQDALLKLDRLPIKVWHNSRPVY